MDNEQTIQTVKASRKAVRRAHWYYMFFRGGGGYTYNMAMMLAPAMGIILNSIYKAKDKIAEEVKKYYFYFDTNVPFAGVVVGLLAGLEEKRAANPEKVPVESIPAFAVGIMGSVASIGDIIQQGIIQPLILTLGISLCGDRLNPNPIGPIFAMVAVGVVTCAISYTLWMKTYDLGDVILTRVLKGGLMEKILKASCILGCVAMGGLLAKYVTITTSLAWVTSTTKFVVQTQLFDAIMPKLLPLLVTMLLLWRFKKGASPNKVVWIVMGLSLVLALIGILGDVPVIK